MMNESVSCSVGRMKLPPQKVPSSWLNTFGGFFRHLWYYLDLIHLVHLSWTQNSTRFLKPVDSW